MSVVLQAYNDITGTTPINDNLEGGSFGMSLGQVTNGNYTPIADKVSNSGRKTIFLRHDGTNPITNLAVYIGEFGLNSGDGYGGSDTAANDIAFLLGEGAASGTSENNIDGNSSGIWLDCDQDTSDAASFNISARPGQVFTFGKAGQGQSLGTAFGIPGSAMAIAPTQSNPSAAQDGVLGPNGDTINGFVCVQHWRLYARNAILVSGIYQYEFTYIYAFTN